jgi:hypothetical protein
VTEIPVLTRSEGKDVEKDRFSLVAGEKIASGGVGNVDLFAKRDSRLGIRALEKEGRI